MERCPPAFVQSVRVGPILQEPLHGFDCSSVGCPMQKGAPLFRPHFVNVESVAENDCCNVVKGLATPLVRLQRMLQCLMEPFVPQPPVVEQLTHHLLVAARRGAKEHRKDRQSTFHLMARANSVVEQEAANLSQSSFHVFVASALRRIRSGMRAIWSRSLGISPFAESGTRFHRHPIGIRGRRR